MKVSVYIATSLDGFIARLDGSLDWLEQANATNTTGDDFGYADFMSTVDALVIGRNTYDTVLGFGAWPYEGKHVVVMTSNPDAIATSHPAHYPAIETATGAIADVVQDLAARGKQHIYLDGGNTIQRALREDIVSHLTVTLIPVLLGEGIPLFGPLPHDQWLHLESSEGYPNGFVQGRWTITRSRT